MVQLRQDGPPVPETVPGKEAKINSGKDLANDVTYE
jgi:hypothetical protein